MEVSCACVSGIWQISRYYPQMSFRFNSAGLVRIGTICFHFRTTQMLHLDAQPVSAYKDLEGNCRKSVSYQSKRKIKTKIELNGTHRGMQFFISICKWQLHKKSILALTAACAEIKESFHFTFPTTFCDWIFSFVLTMNMNAGIERCRNWDQMA